MHRVKKSALATVFLWTTLSVTVLGTASASAAPKPLPPPDAVITLPAGLACAFELTIEVRGGNQVMREFTDQNGNVVRFLSAGKGAALTFIGNGDTYVMPANGGGSVAHVTYHPDGSTTWMTTGHNVLILFPTDIPAGPSTTLTVGRVVFTVDTNGVFTVSEVRGKTTDICAELSS